MRHFINGRTFLVIILLVLAVWGTIQSPNVFASQSTFVLVGGYKTNDEPTVHTWKSDKTLLEIVKEESPNIEVLPLQIFFYQRLYDVTLERYLPFYRLKEAAVLATYDEAAECLDQLETLSGKEKACALFALTIFENKYRPRPEWMQKYFEQKADAAEVPAFNHSSDFQFENPLEIWSGDYEPNSTIEPSFWASWEKKYQDAFKDKRSAFAAVDPELNNSLFINSGNYTEPELPKNRKNNIANSQSAQQVADSEESELIEIQRLEASREFARLLSYRERLVNNSSDPDRSVKDVKFTLFNQSYPPECFILGRPELGCFDGFILKYNSSSAPKTVERIVRELQTVRLSYDGSFLIPEEDAEEVLDDAMRALLASADVWDSKDKIMETTSYFDAWESKRNKSDKSLLEVVKEETPKIEVLPSLFCWHNVFYDMTFERWLPVYRLKEAAVLASCSEAWECLEQFDSLSGKEKACALFALSVFEIKRRPKYRQFGPIFPPNMPREYNLKKPRFDYYPYVPLDYTTIYRIWLGVPQPDITIERNYWARWNIVFAKALNDKELAFPAAPSSQERYEQPTQLLRSTRDELVAAWFDGIDACAKLAQKYVDRPVSAADFLEPFPIDFLDYLRATEKQTKPLDPNCFGICFLKSVENFHSDNPAEMQEAFALREYWLRLHALRRPEGVYVANQYANAPSMSGMRSAVNSSYHEKTVGDVANELKKLRLEGELEVW